VNNLKNKRKKVVIAVLAAVFSISCINAASVYSMALLKQIFMTLANIAMYAVIWDIYFDEELSSKNVKSILVDLSIITIISAGTAYITAKGIVTLINQINDWLGAIGWLVAGLIAGLGTGILGSAWAFYCDDLYRNSNR
jgi:uncharacterized membrane protein YfbV (UPF0208 family)